MQDRRMASESDQHVVILLGAYNGARWLPAQLDSLRRQTHQDWSLTVSDDGSSDDSQQCVTDFAATVGQDVRLRAGRQSGFVANFLSLACAPGAEAAYYAFCDQDDIWYADKLERALTWLRTAGERPALYCGRTRLVDEQLQVIGHSTPFRRPTGFQNALVQSIAGANTMVFNEAARRLISSAGWQVDVASHDWWLYLLVSGMGGAVFYDAEPVLDYRQHARALVGSNIGLGAKWLRLMKMLSGRYRDWNAKNSDALHALPLSLPPRQQALLADFDRMRSGSLSVRWRAFRRARVYRQTWLTHGGLLLALLLRRL